MLKEKITKTDSDNKRREEHDLGRKNEGTRIFKFWEKKIQPNKKD